MASAQPAATGAVMAGGKSRRFGQDKALLTLNGETLLARALRTLGSVTREQLVIGPPDRATHSSGVRVVSDEFPDVGPLGGIYTALRAAEDEIVAVVACDMPFLNAGLLAHLLSLAEAADVVLPVVDGHGQQLHAVYRRSCLGAIRQQLDRGDFKIDRFFDRIRLRRVEESELRHSDSELRSFRNVNTPEDWAEAQTLLAV